LNPVIDHEVYYGQVTTAVTMVWPSRSLGAFYSTLYCNYGDNVFSMDEVTKLVGSRAKVKLYLHRLRRIGWAFSFPRERKGTYRLQPPEVCVYTECGMIRGLTGLRRQEYAGLLGTYATGVIDHVDSIKSLVLYGSVARGNPGSDSDVDLLAVIDNGKDVRPAFNAMMKIEREGPTAKELEHLENEGIHTHISILPMSLNRLASHPFVLLDIVDEGLAIYDDGAFESEAIKIKRNLKRLGAKRVFLGDRDWYWDLDPSYSVGAVVEV
jgi:predicted nucleotidyltransferase